MSVERFFMYKVPDSAPREDQIICDLANKGFDAQKVFRAAYTFYRIRLEEELAQSGRLLVGSGLFRGMHLYPRSLASQLIPKVQGTYEKEIQDFILNSSERYDRFLDVGCAEGFYLSGIARWKHIPCHGVDVDPGSEQAVKYIAEENCVQEMVSFSRDIESSREFIIGSLLCLVDVDGAEFDVLGELNELFESSCSLKTVLLIVESDATLFSRQNIPELISYLVRSDWCIESTIHQDSRDRFVGSSSELSFLEQVVRGAEGRPGGQCWIVASKKFNP